LLLWRWASEPRASVSGAAGADGVAGADPVLGDLIHPVAIRAYPTSD